MNGSWHRYRPGEALAPAARPRPARARGARARSPSASMPRSSSCSRRAPLSSIPSLVAARAGPARPGVRRRRGPPPPARSVAVPRPRSPSRSLDQRALAGIGNVYKNEVLWIERVSPFSTVADVDDETLDRLIATARRLLVANAIAEPRRRAGHDQRRSRRTGPALRLRSRRPPVPPLSRPRSHRPARAPTCRARPTGARPARETPTDDRDRCQLPGRR